MAIGSSVGQALIVALGKVVVTAIVSTAAGSLAGYGAGLLWGPEVGAIAGTVVAVVVAVVVAGGLEKLDRAHNWSGFHQPVQPSIDINAEELKYSNSAYKTDRPYQDSALTIQEIIDSGPPRPDPQGRGGLWWKIEGNFNNSNGFYELLISPDKATIWHFLFESF